VLHGIALRYFVEVARSGSLAAASETLHVAVSALSRQIAKLEAEVGTPLFERLARGMVLTESGELLAEHARRALLEGDAVLDEIAALRALGHGSVRVGCTEGFTRDFLPSVLADYYAQHPRTRFALRAGTPAQVEQWVATGEVDLGVAFSTSGSNAVGVEYRVPAPVCALMPPAHALARRRMVSLDDLLAYPVAVLERGTTVRELIDLCCAARGIRFEPVLTSNSTSAMYRFAVLSGVITLGSAISVAGPALRDASLVAKRIDEPLLNERRIEVTVMKERRLPQAVDAFLGVLKARLKAGPADAPASRRRERRDGTDGTPRRG
jgi:DNA-binding transcriptional LysR family regulator